MTNATIVQERRVGVLWSLVLYGAEPYGIKPRKKRGELKKELIHSRKITVNCYETDEDVLAIR